MGIEGAPSALRGSCPTELLRKSVVAVADCDLDDACASETVQANDNNDTDDECRRRTSIPPTFAYGAEMQLGRGPVEERRYRSFDWSGSTASQSSTKAASLESLTTRIQQENEKVKQRTAKLGRRFEWMRSMKSLFSSSTKKEQVQLLQMQMVAEVAKGTRSLAILNDMKTLVMTMEEEELESEVEKSSSSRESRSSMVSTIDGNNQRLLDGIENADQVLADDNLHHILSIQTRWLQELICLHADKKNNVSKKHGVAPSVVMQQFLNEFVRPDGMQRVPCAFDLPTVALVRFEKLINRYKFMKPALKKALDQVCQDTMASVVARSSSGNASVFENREARDVMQSLIREIVDAIAEEAWVVTNNRSILRAFVEQMVFSRLACACLRSASTELDEMNSTWREQVAKASTLGLHQVGLPFEVEGRKSDETGLSVVDGELSGVLGGGSDVDAVLFAKSIEAFNKIPYLVPSCVLAAFLNAVRVLYRETNEMLGVSPSCMSADVLLPLMVFVLSRSDLPHLHSQVFMMEEYAIDESKEGSEAAYYLACLKAAMGYIMTKDKICTEAEE
uniref:VPS9 domain-containing protein n=2 Tax=Globisporangium ultimum (strain ATCC 200006 / CBS 805.95 / DAOM BR144) TaxID=431595 RepID=K3X6B7_GLOUD